MMNNKLNKKAVAGLTIFLQVVVMIFVIGILVMAIALTGAEMQDSVDDVNGTAHAVIGNTTAAVTGATDWFGIFIVIAAVVVLVIMIVIIIQSLRAGGLMGQGA